MDRASCKQKKSTVVITPSSPKMKSKVVGPPYRSEEMKAWEFLPPGVGAASGQ